MKTKMAVKAIKCAQIREQMFDAASDSFSGGMRDLFGAHLRSCAACAKEFRRVQSLAQAIDHKLSVRLSVEPSPQLIANVRREIAAQPRRVTWLWQRSAWVTAVGVFAALAIALLAVRSVHEFNPPTHDDVVASITVPSIPKPIVHPRVKTATEAATAAQPRKPALAVVSHVSRRAPHRKTAEPEVIVEPGQMQAILRFAAATESGEIDGSKLVADQKNAAEPLAIKPIVITPLKIAALDAGPAPASGNGEDGDKDFVAGHMK